MLPALSPNEESQTLQTIEMFEVIAASDPLDHEALEILREAYFKLGRDKELLRTARRIADAYVQLGQISSAILEYESILRRCPNDPEAQAALEKIGVKTPPVEPASSPPRALPQPAMAGEVSPRHAQTAPEPEPDREPVELSDGKETMYKLFVDGKHIGAADFDLLWVATDKNETNLVEPFIQRLAEKQLLPLETSLQLLVEKSRAGFIPLDRYDIDIELARSYPRDLCLQGCMLPFDRLSKSLLVATANPFNQKALHALMHFHRQTEKHHSILWYIASPPELIKALRKTFR